jgi:hypothetical protein
VGNASLSYKGHRYPAEVISHCVWLYFPFPLSFREVEVRPLGLGSVVVRVGGAGLVMCCVGGGLLAQKLRSRGDAVHGLVRREDQQAELTAQGVNAHVSERALRTEQCRVRQFLHALGTWSRAGQVPSPSSIARSCSDFGNTYGSGCFYDADFRPTPFAAQVYPRPGGLRWPAMSAAQERVEPDRRGGHRLLKRHR